MQSQAAEPEHSIETVETVMDQPYMCVRRMVVPGGWLYLTTTGFFDTKTCASTFVPAVQP
jgi:hypothetical protein